MESKDEGRERSLLEYDGIDEPRVGDEEVSKYKVGEIL